MFIEQITCLAACDPSCANLLEHNHSAGIQRARRGSIYLCTDSSDSDYPADRLPQLDRACLVDDRLVSFWSQSTALGHGRPSVAGSSKGGKCDNRGSDPPMYTGTSLKFARTSALKSGILAQERRI